MSDPTKLFPRFDDWAATARSGLGTGVCPHCGSQEIRGGPVDVTATHAYQDVECEDCGATWCDRYGIDGLYDPNTGREIDLVTPLWFVLVVKQGTEYAFAKAASTEEEAAAIADTLREPVGPWPLIVPVVLPGYVTDETKTSVGVSLAAAATLAAGFAKVRGTSREQEAQTGGPIP